MSFIPNANQVARDAMQEIDKPLVGKYEQVISFFAKYPKAASKIRGKSAPSIGSKSYIERQAANFANARKPHIPKIPLTTPDEMVSVILHEFFGIRESDLARVKEEHKLSMGAENFVGELLERYLATVLEPHGWIWCSGAMIKSVDFIKPPAKPTGVWHLLQVKNRDNSENSSSSSVRVGTKIEKWFRTFSRKEKTNWENFPDESLRKELSEEGFKKFVRDYLCSLKAQL